MENIEDIRNNFRIFLNNKVKEGVLTESDANTQYSDADYPRKHEEELGINYFEMFKTEDTFNNLLNILQENFRNNGKSESTFFAYKRALENFKEFFNEYNRNKKLDDYIKDYKSNFDKTWENEEYKWEAIKCFQDNWDINSTNFLEMLKSAFAKTYNLLNSHQNFPIEMIYGYTLKNENKIKEMFSHLYNENENLIKRIEKFKEESNKLKELYPDLGKNHFQSENAISVYLWLRYPDKYYIYKYRDVKAVSEKLNSNYKFIKGNYEQNIQNHIEFYNEICTTLQNDTELKEILDNHLNDNCYIDPNLKTLTMDFCFYISRYSTEQNDWEAKEYSPNITIEEWKRLLVNKNIFHNKSIKIIKEFNKYPNGISCSDLEEKRHIPVAVSRNISIQLGKRIEEYTKCQINENSGSKYVDILFTMRGTQSKENGSWIWKLRPELSHALEEVDFREEEVDFGEEEMNDKTQNNKTNFPLNQILYGPPGTGKTYNTKDKIEEIICKNNKETKNNIVDKIENLTWYEVIALTMYKHKKENYKVPELKELEEIKEYTATKNNISLNQILWGQLLSHTPRTNTFVNYSRRQAPFIFDKLENSKWKLNQEGLEFVEEQLSDYINNNNTDENKTYYSFITFHQSYSYEDFIEGIKPSLDKESDGLSYNIENGIFKKLCLKANSDPLNNYIIVIDEINRGNISKIFGELITLIEEDKRVTPNGELNFDKTIVKDNELLVTLPYSKNKFGVPSNLYILGTMNTSDRSIASIDIALRRRFKFIEMMPDEKLVAKFNCGFDEIFKLLNQKIKVLLDRDHQIGHSYFIKTKYENADITVLKDIWFSEILPLLNEYFYGDWEKLKLVIPGFIKPIDTDGLPKELTSEYIESNYEFKSKSDLYSDEEFENALKQLEYDKKEA